MHLHTIHLEHSVLLAVYTVLTLANARLQRQMPGVRFFVLYNLLDLVGSLAVLLRGGIPDVLSIAVGNICVIAAYTALYQSMSRLFGLRRAYTVAVLIWLGLGSLCMVWWGSLHPDTPLRLLSLSVFLGVQQLFLALVLLTGKRETRQLSWMFGGMLLALAVVNVGRIAAVALGGAPQNYLQSGPALSAIVLINTCLQCGVLMAYVWMTAALLRRDLEVRASTDPLTSLLNRRAMEAAAAEAIEAISAGKGVFSAIIVDLDAYKSLNDRLGHAAGDKALLAISSCLQCELRSTDLLARMGGDEFVLLLPRTAEAEAADIAERLRGCVQALDLGLEDPMAELTASFGVAQAMPGETWEQLLARCDRALYAAKRQGGNAVWAELGSEASRSETAIHITMIETTPLTRAS